MTVKALNAAKKARVSCNDLLSFFQCKVNYTCENWKRPSEKEMLFRDLHTTKTNLFTYLRMKMYSHTPNITGKYKKIVILYRIERVFYKG